MRKNVVAKELGHDYAMPSKRIGEHNLAKCVTQNISLWITHSKKKQKRFHN